MNSSTFSLSEGPTAQVAQGDPDEPEPTRENGHDKVEDLVPETVTLDDDDTHGYSFVRTMCAFIPAMVNGNLIA